MDNSAIWSKPAHFASSEHWTDAAGTRDNRQAVAPKSTLFGMSSATHVSTLESFYSMHIVLATSCSHLSTACVSCVH